ncbi:hypothetical protein ACVWW5_008581 [Bradyrhizobium sp. LM3.4]
MRIETLSRLRKMDADVIETLECVSREWKVIQQVSERLVSRACKAIPAVLPRTRFRAEPKLYPMRCSPA